MKHLVAFPGEHIKRIVAALVLTMVLAPILLLAYPFGSAVGYTVGFGPHGIVAADLNGDGKLDLASANAEDGTVSVLIGNGDGTYLPHADYPVGTRPKFVQTGDFNRDGKVDLIAANEVSGSVTVLPGKGDGTFGPGISSPAGCISPHAIQIADLNGDGKLDAIVACWNGTIVSVLFGNGDGTFQPAVNYTTGAWPEAVIIGDFNKDGKLDFAINNYMANTISVLLGTGGGSFAPAVSYAVGTLPHFINAADLNKDGNLDLFTANDGSNDVSVLFGTGTGTFSPAVSLSVGTSPESVAVGDVDGDGNLDLVTANSVSNDLSVLLGTGTGTFGKPVSYPVGTTPFHVILAQLNGDGKLDAAVGNYGANNISVLLSSAGGPPPPGTVYLSDLAWTSAVNGWGPVERDMSNGEQAAGDGHTISLRGTQYAKGLGVHALSDIQYAIGNCTNFTSVIGIDDEVAGNGSVIFQVLLNGVKQYDSGVMTGADAAKSVSLNLTGISQLELVVAVGATQNFDHADWANAQITCSATTQPPTVTSTSPASGATGAAVNTTVNGTFSSAMQAGSLTTSTVTLAPQGTTTPISGTVGYNGITKTVTLTPAAPLAGGAVYTATIKGGASGAKDSTGTPMAADVVWSFTTASTGGGTTAFLSDRTWAYAVSGWGPVEKNTSNGEQAAGDGKPINIAGVVYAKGLGAHANADIRYPANGCSLFTTDVGVDNEVGTNGSVVFQIWVDGVKQYDSGVMTGGVAAKSASIPLTGSNKELRLVVTDAGDGNSFDHADWAGAKITCVPDTVPPTVTAKTPAAGATGVAANTAINATFSKFMQPGSLTTNTMTLVKQGTTTALAGTVSYDPTTYTAALTLTAVLAANTSYTATIKGGASGATDMSGNPIAADIVWTFTTASGQVVTYLSDLAWTSAVSGWGPVEKDMSNGEQAAGDGHTITIKGATYAKGLGAHATSDIRYVAAGCTAFASDVGVDDEVGSNGSVVFQIFLDGVQKYDSGVMTGGTAAKTVNVALAGNTELRLVVTDAGDGNSFDHADWAVARIACGQ